MEREYFPTEWFFSFDLLWRNAGNVTYVTSEQLGKKYKVAIPGVYNCRDTVLSI